MQHDIVDILFELLIEKNIKLTTAESCTGGLLAAIITHKSGATQIFDRGFVTYSNKAKSDMLDVPEDMLDTYGAVSNQVAEAMASGALKNSEAGLAVSITGIAGPNGGSKEKPVGKVFFGYALKGGSVGSLEQQFKGNREEIQAKATVKAIKHLIAVLGK